jgi:hypothetical protein
VRLAETELQIVRRACASCDHASLLDVGSSSNSSRFANGRGRSRVETRPRFCRYFDGAFDGGLTAGPYIIPRSREVRGARPSALHEDIAKGLEHLSARLRAADMLLEEVNKTLPN